MPTERDREMAQEWLRADKALSYSVEHRAAKLTDLLASVRRAGEARALAAVRTSMMVGPVVAEAVAGEAERALGSDP